jgi:iron complex transport system permease protein
MPPYSISLLKRVLTVSGLLALLLLIVAFAGVVTGSTDQRFQAILAQLLGQGSPNSILGEIIWRIRLPRVILAALVGATLSVGGLVFQALLRNPLAEPYILGISGGSAVGAIIGILLGLSQFPGVALLAFCGSMSTLLLVLLVVSGKAATRKDSLILGGVMVNALCSSVIMFLLSVTQNSRLHSILFWLMGDLSLSDTHQLLLLSGIVLPCLGLIFFLARPMNLLLLGEEMALNMGLPVRLISLVLLSTASLMVSATVCCTGLVGFVGLVMPHLLRLCLGPDHRVLVPACVLGGGAYLIFCDLVARTLASQSEMPVGVITALIGAPLFIFLLKRAKP